PRQRPARRRPRRGLARRRFLKSGRGPMLRCPTPVRAAGLTFAFILMTSLAASASTREANITTGCVDRFDPAADYFPDKITVDSAQGFAVLYHASYKV